jgi:hypothetical protein
VSQFPGHDDEDDSFDDTEAADDYVAEFYDGIGDDDEEVEGLFDNLRESLDMFKRFTKYN